MKESSKPCVYCSNILHPPSTQGAGLDRIDNSKGYVSGNIQSCCPVCNKIRSNVISVEETHAAVKAMLAFPFGLLL